MWINGGGSTNDAGKMAERERARERERNTCISSSSRHLESTSEALT